MNWVDYGAERETQREYCVLLMGKHRMNWHFSAGNRENEQGHWNPTNYFRNTDFRFALPELTAGLHSKPLV